MISTSQSLILIAIMSGITILIRFIPFLLFSKNTPKPIVYLGEVLPYSIVAMLVIYCLKDIDFSGASHGIPEIISVALVAVLHKWKHNTLLSILSGTICYMILVQIVFV